MSEFSKAFVWQCIKKFEDGGLWLISITRGQESEKKAFMRQFDSTGSQIEEDGSNGGN